MAKSSIITAVKSSSQGGKFFLKRQRSCDIGAADQDTFALFALTTVHSRQNEPDTGRLVWKPLSRSAKRKVARDKRSMYVSGQYNCGLHCDFPTECVRNIYSAWTARKTRLTDEQSPPVSRPHEEQGSFEHEKDLESETQEERVKERKKDAAAPEQSHGRRRSRRLWVKEAREK